MLIALKYVGSISTLISATYLYSLMSTQIVSVLLKRLYGLSQGPPFGAQYYLESPQTNHLKRVHVEEGLSCDSGGRAVYSTPIDAVRLTACTCSIAIVSK